jgi:hypothetical protein
MIAQLALAAVSFAIILAGVKAAIWLEDGEGE